MNGNALQSGSSQVAFVHVAQSTPRSFRYTINHVLAEVEAEQS
jgi:hypothetical protein